MRSSVISESLDHFFILKIIRYGEDLETREEELKMRSRVLSRLITPGIVENYQQDDYESDEEDAFSSVSNNFQRKEVRERSSSIVQDSSMK